jgi:outer membrane biosynthesis protein TonB
MFYENEFSEWVRLRFNFLFCCRAVELPARATAALITDLEPGTYVCSVTAQSEAGASQPATIEAEIKAPPPVVPPITDKVVLPESPVKETPTTTTETTEKTEQPETQAEEKTEATQPTTTTTTTTTEDESSTTEEQPKDSAIRATTTGVLLMASVAVAAFAMI